MAKKDMPSFTDQDRPEAVKKIYRALKRKHPEMSAEMKARIAARQGKPGKQHQGPPYTAPIKTAGSLGIRRLERKGIGTLKSYIKKRKLGREEVENLLESYGLESRYGPLETWKSSAHIAEKLRYKLNKKK